MDYALKVPGLASIILKHDIDAEVTGLDQYSREDWPPVATVFWAFRIMVGVGMLMVLAGLWSGFQRLRGKLYDNRTLLRFSLFMGPMGFVAVIAEVGRQPWVVYGLLRTADAASPIDKAGVAGSLIAFIVVYFLVFGAGTFYILRKMAGNPEQVAIPDYAKHKPTMAAERIYDEEV